MAPWLWEADSGERAQATSSTRIDCFNSAIIFYFIRRQTAENGILLVFALFAQLVDERVASNPIAKHIELIEKPLEANAAVQNAISVERVSDNWMWNAFKQTRDWNWKKVSCLSRAAIETWFCQLKHETRFISSDHSLIRRLAGSCLYWCQTASDCLSLMTSSMVENGALVRRHRFAVASRTSWKM